MHDLIKDCWDSPRREFFEFREADTLLSASNAMSGQMESDLVKSVWKRIGIYLENKKDQIYEEIQNYPPPIPDCDLQFNHLLEERERIGRELRRMHEIANESRMREDAIKLIDEFIRSSDYFDEEWQRRIRASLEEDKNPGG